MSTTTSNLGLFEYDPVADANQTYNITNALNNNWDKIDTFSGTVADKDLSNLSPTGQAVIDGQWVSSRKELIVNGTPPTIEDVSFDLSTYLPNDGYKYEVLFSGFGTTGNAIGDRQSIGLHTDLQPNNAYVYYIRTRTESTAYSAGSVILPVGTGRIVSVNHNTNNTGIYTLYAFGYRRIGSNN